MFELCDCGKKAIWVYLPGYSSGSNPYHCDNCVPRDCSCEMRFIVDNEKPSGEENIDWKWYDNEKTIWKYIDEKGRFYPCIEFDYDKDGFERELNPHI